MKIDILRIATNARSLQPNKLAKNDYLRVEKKEPLINVFIDPDSPKLRMISKQGIRERISVRV